MAGKSKKNKGEPRPKGRPPRKYVEQAPETTVTTSGGTLLTGDAARITLLASQSYGSRSERRQPNNLPIFLDSIKTSTRRSMGSIPTEECPHGLTNSLSVHCVSQLNDYVTKRASFSQAVDIKWFGHPGDSEHDIRARKFTVRWSHYLANPDIDLRKQAVEKGKEEEKKSELSWCEHVEEVRPQNKFCDSAPGRRKDEGQVGIVEGHEDREGSGSSSGVDPMRGVVQGEKFTVNKLARCFQRPPQVTAVDRIYSPVESGRAQACCALELWRKNPKPMGHTVKCSKERKNCVMLHIGDILDGSGQRQCGRSSNPPPSNVKILWGMTRTEVEVGPQGWDGEGRLGPLLRHLKDSCQEARGTPSQIKVTISSASLDTQRTKRGFCTCLVNAGWC
ncbi:hypothetical protein B0H14DRAFT_2621381 [Mycena olivaceomarginata]|nr:hypothetical protein B0H14DRAFT_2621381 [Mycena olivaceomarginata]